MKSTLLIALLVAGCSGTPNVPDAPPAIPAATPVHLKLIGINDFHGHLEGPSGKVTIGETKVEAGGIDYLAARIEEIMKYNPNTLVVGAGDMVGASPLISALFHDEPAIEVLNEAGLAITAVGNHEFDEGIDELMRLKNGGCHPKDGCLDGDPYEGAKFDYLAANVTHKSNGETVLPAYVIREFEGVKVGFIGLTLEGTPKIVDPTGIKTLDFGDEAETINKATEDLQSQGIEAIVVLIHEGGMPAARDQPDGCEGISGPIVDIVQNTSKAVDIFVTGHTHQAYICTIDERLVTSAKSYGQMFTEIDVELNRETKDVERASARNLVNDRIGTPKASVTKIVEKYAALVSTQANKQIGEITTDIPRDTVESGDSPMGRLIADVQLWATKDADKGAAQLSFMNGGGVRGDLKFAPQDQEAPGAVTFAEAHEIQPFGNSLVTMTLTGAQIHELLESQFGERTRIMHPSANFTYAWSEAAPNGKKIDFASIKLNGKPIVAETEYRVTVNSFIAAGGDGYEVLTQGTNRLGGPIDLDAFVTYFQNNSPVASPAKSRIQKIP